MTPTDQIDRTTCRHFTGQHNGTCNAGVIYLLVRKKDKLMGLVPTGRFSYPCVGCENTCGATCEHYSPPTEVEYTNKVARDRYIQEATQTVLGLTGGLMGMSGFIKCPACGGTDLRYTVAAFTGHVSLSCSSKDCLSVA